MQPEVAVTCSFPLQNTGASPATSRVDPQASAAGDVFRLSATASDGWRAWLAREVVGIDNGDTLDIDVYAGRSRAGAGGTTLTLTAVSESDPTARATATCEV